MNSIRIPLLRCPCCRGDITDRIGEILSARTEQMPPTAIRRSCGATSFAAAVATTTHIKKTFSPKEFPCGPTWFGRLPSILLQRGNTRIRCTICPIGPKALTLSHDECSGSVKDLDFVQRISQAPPRWIACGRAALRNAYLSGCGFAWDSTLAGIHGPANRRAWPAGSDCHPIHRRAKPHHERPRRLDTLPAKSFTSNKVGKLFSTAHALARGKQIVKDKHGKESTSDNIVAWTNLYNGKTRVFATTIGHNNETVADPDYLDLVTCGLLWSVHKLDDAHLKQPAKK